MARVTVINDSPEFLDLMRDILEWEGYPATTLIGDEPDTLPRILASEPDLIILDMRMGEAQAEAWQLAERIRSHPGLADLPVLISSADARGLQALTAELAETYRVGTITKPFSLQEITHKIERLLGTAPAEAVDQPTA